MNAFAICVALIFFTMFIICLYLMREVRSGRSKVKRYQSALSDKQKIIDVMCQEILEMNRSHKENIDNIKRYYNDQTGIFFNSENYFRFKAEVDQKIDQMKNSEKGFYQPVGVSFYRPPYSVINPLYSDDLFKNSSYYPVVKDAENKQMLSIVEYIVVVDEFLKKEFPESYLQRKDQLKLYLKYSYQYLS
ncbi:hypothetical protein [Oceanospirillum sediminis]|uniref:Uncharacterized protein n=1 Tax=Oceanospirillum sediminis TaxID=2760088 RepID=A0A839INT4_9GAMM|nr:hypothetical protein [Oceanospirillum sediminis]MBB1485936.1 hypothetical protein [Oceanospirillum sediminis]